MSPLEKVKQHLKEMGASPKKSLGQNFLVGQGVVDQIHNKLTEIKPSQIVEIGPGLGALTESLLKTHSEVLLIELDNKFAEYWQNLGANTLNKDALKLDWSKIELKPQSCLVSNLPYQISSSIVIDRSFSPLAITDMVLMFQKEVAQRILAEPKTKAYSLLSVIAQSCWHIELLLEAGPNEFYPSPKVASRVLVFKRKAQQPPKEFLSFVKSAFAQRRKKLVKNLKSVESIDSKSLLSQLIKMGYTENTRAEEVSVEDFIELYRVCGHGN